MAFAVLMGASRAFYGNYGEKINLDRFMAVSSVLCILSYLCLVFMPVPVLSLAGCALCGLSVESCGPELSRASKALPAGGTALFALLALGGDIGCSGGPTLVGMVSGMCKGNLKIGILAALIFPVLLLTGAKFETKKDKISS